MNGEKVEIDVQITAEDYRRTLFWHSKAKLFIWAVFGGLTLVAFVFGVVFMSLSKPEVSLVILAPILIPVLLIAFNIWRTFANIRKQAETLSLTTEGAKFSFTNLGM